MCTIRGQGHECDVEVDAFSYYIDVEMTREIVTLSIIRRVNSMQNNFYGLALSPNGNTNHWVSFTKF